MAVVDKYVGTEFTGTAAASQTVAPGTRPPAITSKGETALRATQTFVKGASDSDGSVYRLLRGISTGMRIQALKVMCDAISGLTSADLGFYKTDGGAVLNKNVLMSAQTLASASRTLDGLSNVSIADLCGGKTIADLLGLDVTTQNDPLFVDLCMTVNTAGGNSGNIGVDVNFTMH